ncbi:efflux transporter outer membrane subunit [Stieleria sp. TO1_6]|uniref:efflux transporter outer membrane subunit n=1 Tax=Stieleria tagensis TaxID=2956795 RepID=UPI00209B036C|nr:efflux transporter outer membrane subunit [Stieleria tagensis]MCO8124186.1 efflux transporter outer membrane subunit [Stieleria tagensis]
MQPAQARATVRTATLRGAMLMLFSLCLFTSMACTQMTTCSSWVKNGLKVGPEYCRPSAPLEPQWIDMQSEPRLIDETADIANWWRQLGDPTLNGLIEMAYAQNLTIRQAGTRIQQAEAIRGIAVGNLFPQVQQAVGDIQSIRTSENIAVPSPVRRFGQHDLGMQAGWELDFWGRFRRSVEVADAQLDASIAGYDEITVLLLANVAASYVEIRTVQERLQIARTIIEFQQGSLAIAQARYAANQTNKLDVLQAQNNIDVTQAAIPALESQLRMANNRLCVLLGIPPQDLVAELSPGSIPTVSRSVQVGVPADLLRRRPDVRRTERLMKAQSEQIGIAEAELYPHISLVGSFEWEAESSDDLFDSGSIFGLIGPGFSWNVLNYGRLRNGIEFEQQRFRESVYNYQQTVLTAQQEVEDAMIGFLKAQEQADELADAVAQVNEAEKIAETLYQTGATDFNRVFVIQAFQFAQQDDLVVSRASVVFNLINLYKSLGGGWQIRCPTGQDNVPLAAYSDQADGGMIGEIPEIEEDDSRSDIGVEPKNPSDAPPTTTAPPKSTQPENQRLKELLDADVNDKPSSPSDDQQRLKELLEQDL